LENWVQFVQNSAHSVDRISETHGLKCWVHTYRLRKWQFAGQLARQQDHRWSRQILEWKPNGGLGRSQGAPKTRWEDQIVNLAGGNWMQLATDENLWAEAGDVFANRDSQVLYRLHSTIGLLAEVDLTLDLSLDCTLHV